MEIDNETNKEIIERAADFFCGHHRVYVVDDGLVSGTMTLRCQDCPREFSKVIGRAIRRDRRADLKAADKMPGDGDQ